MPTYKVDLNLSCFDKTPILLYSHELLKNYDFFFYILAPSTEKKDKKSFNLELRVCSTSFSFYVDRSGSEYFKVFTSLAAAVAGNLPKAEINTLFDFDPLCNPQPQP